MIRPEGSRGFTVAFTGGVTLWVLDARGVLSSRAVRVVGALLFVLGCAATAYSTWAIYRRGRPQDVVFGVLAPVTMVVALVGLLLIFVPGFFD